MSADFAFVIVTRNERNGVLMRFFIIGVVVDCLIKFVAKNTVFHYKYSLHSDLIYKVGK